MVCTDGITVSMCLCMLLDANSLVSYWNNVHTDVMFICVDIYVHVCMLLYQFMDPTTNYIFCFQPMTPYFDSMTEQQFLHIILNGQGLCVRFNPRVASLNLQVLSMFLPNACTIPSGSITSKG